MERVYSVEQRELFIVTLPERLTAARSSAEVTRSILPRTGRSRRPGGKICLLEVEISEERKTVKFMRPLKVKNDYYFPSVGHCGAFYALKWRIWRAEMYFSPPK